MILIALTLAATSSLALQQPASPPKSNIDPVMKAKFDALLAESAAALKAGDKRLMYAKLDEAAAVSENAEVMHKIGHHYEADKAFPGSAAKALHWYIEAASLGHLEAQSHVAKVLEDDDKLSNEQYHALVDALEDGTRNFNYGPGSDALDRLAKKHGAAGQCAVDLAKRLGYASDGNLQDLLTNARPTAWYIVRRGSGTASSGDKLSIMAAQPGSMIGGHMRLRVSATGFTGIRYKKHPLSDGDTMTLKEYTGFREKASAQGQRDAQTILNACKPR